MRLHLHWPRISEAGPMHLFQICRCSARRTKALTPVAVDYTLIPKGWPKPRDGWV